MKKKVLVGVCMLLLLVSLVSATDFIAESYTTGQDDDEKVKSNENVGQTFNHSPGFDYDVNKISVYMYRDSDAASQIITVSLRSSWDGADLGNATLSSDNLTTSFAFYNVTFSPPVPLLNGSTYYIRVTSNDDDGRIYYGYDKSSASYTKGDRIDKNGNIKEDEDILFIIYKDLDITPPTFDILPTDQTIEFGDSFSYDIDASDETAIDSYFINDTTNFVIDEVTGVITNVTALTIRDYSLNISVNDTSNNIISQAITITVQDTIEPQWNPLPTNQDIDYNTAFSYDVDATDLQTIVYSIDDTTNFVIDSNTGVITNNTLLSISTYTLQINATDLTGNVNSTSISVQVNDITPPTFDILPTDQTVELGDSFSYDIDASDETAIDSYFINDTTNFVIDEVTGVITNTTELTIRDYSLNISVNDTSNNIISQAITITVQDTIEPQWNPLPTNQAINYETPFSYDVDATDLQTIVYSIDDTTNFVIDSNTGVITNNTLLSIGTYTLQINATDLTGNVNSSVIEIQVNCVVSLTNTSWSSWYNVGACLMNDSILQERNLTQYDSNYCGQVSNQTFYDSQTAICDYIISDEFTGTNLQLIYQR